MQLFVGTILLTFFPCTIYLCGIILVYRWCDAALSPSLLLIWLDNVIITGNFYGKLCEPEDRGRGMNTRADLSPWMIFLYYAVTDMEFFIFYVLFHCTHNLNEASEVANTIYRKNLITREGTSNSPRR